MSLTLRVAIGLVAGLLLGFGVSASHSPWLMRIPPFFDPVGAVFVNAIRVAVIPLIVSSLIVGVAASGTDARKISRLGGRALGLILSVMLVAALFAGAVALPLFAHLNIDKNVVASPNICPHGKIPELAGMELLRKGSRLSIRPVTEREWKTILALAAGKPKRKRQGSTE